MHSPGEPSPQTFERSVGRMRLRVRELTVRRSPRVVVEDVNLDLAAGEVVCISGPSGCGKSSLLRALARLDPASGSIALDGMDISNIPHAEYRRRVSLVFQEAPMFAGTVADNVRFGPALLGKHLEERDVRELIHRFALDADLVDRDASTLSGGEKQRVALARAMANDPDVLLLDEPTSALDPVAANEVLAQVERLASRGVSVVAVLHVEQQARDLKARRYRMDGGRLRVGAA